MKKKFEAVLLLLLFLDTGAFNFALARSLSAIRYRFTTCGASGQHGPTTDQCIELYEQIESPIMNDNLFVKFTDGNMLNGAQGFHVPRRGVYNITIAGAAGGRGLCNIHIGHGVVYEFQANLSPKYELLILVGQKGTGPCDANPDFFLCQRQRQPRRPDNASICSEQWYNWTHSLPTVSNISLQDFVYSLTGGAGGGGASMIWARHIENETFLGHPLFVSAGGGGSPAVLDYDNIKPVIESRTNLQFRTGQDAYNYFLNGRFPTSNDEAILLAGNRGGRPDTTYTAGAGGGFMEILQDGDTDGHSLSQRISFAEGGNNCANSIFTQLQNQNILLNTVGGFGGGGGGCGGGGGGGGYTGGSVFNASNIFPGSGGYSVGFTTDDLSIVTMGRGRIRQYQNENNGYVEIVPADCGCSDECIVNEDTESFECQCNNENHTLAENGFDCYRETIVNFEQVWRLTTSGYTLTGLQVSNVPVLLFSVQLPLQLDSESDRQLQCVIVFIDDENNPKLVTNVVRSGTSSIATQLSNVLIDDDGDTVSISDEYFSVLEYPEVVSGAIIVSNGNCSLSGKGGFPMNISTRRGLEEHEVDFDALYEQFGVHVPDILPIQFSTTAPPPPPQSTSGANVGLIVGVIVALLALLVIASVPILIIVGYWVQKSRRNKRSAVMLPTINATNPTLPAVRYYELDVPNGSPIAKCDIMESNEKDQAQGYSVVDYDKDFDDMLYDLPRDTSECSSQFTSKYGIIAPIHDFTQYNKNRIESSTSTDSWQYPRNKLIYIRELGEGQFGKVLLMKATGIAGFEGKIPVAVKTLTSRDPVVIGKFMEEAELMKKFTHPNIVSILGVSTEDDEDDDSAPLMILEYMPYGDLQNFLEDNKPNELGQTTIKEKHFYSFATDIARALEFLASEKYVHRDVAARNCLVGPDLHIKIADFGMSRGVQDKEYYRVSGRVVLPVRWMSPEALLYGKFTSASDVWAFGVTLWEITSFGESPLDEMDTQEIVRAAQDKSLKHDKPLSCPDDLYALMCQCHAYKVENRITFPEVLTTLEDALKPAAVDIPTEPTATEYQDKQLLKEDPSETDERL